MREDRVRVSRETMALVLRPVFVENEHDRMHLESAFKGLFARDFGSQKQLSVLSDSLHACRHGCAVLLVTLNHQNQTSTCSKLVHASDVCLAVGHLHLHVRSSDETKENVCKSYRLTHMSCCLAYPATTPCTLTKASGTGMGMLLQPHLC